MYQPLMQSVSKDQHTPVNDHTIIEETDKVQKLTKRMINII